MFGQRPLLSETGRPHRRITPTDFSRRAVAARPGCSEVVVHANAEEVHALAEGIAGDDAVAVVDGHGHLAEAHVDVFGEDRQVAVVDKTKNTRVDFFLV